jgi:DNA polymerase-3 subunit epsilon
MNVQIKREETQRRQLALAVETTGLDPALGHRIIEIGAIEMINRQQTGAVFHVYLTPEREVDASAVAAHGLTDEFLADKPRFAEVADEFQEFIRGAELVIHDAPTGIGFLNAELARLNMGPISRLCTVLDTMRLTSELPPGQKHDLSTLSKRYRVDNTERHYHGALTDAQLLADVYLAMTGDQSTSEMREEPQLAQAEADEVPHHQYSVPVLH